MAERTLEVCITEPNNGKGATRWHLTRDGERTLCGSRVVVTFLEEKPAADMCQRNGCRQTWALLDADFRAVRQLLEEPGNGGTGCARGSDSDEVGHG